MRLLVIGAHPDDIESGCGGTIARRIAAGDEVIALYMTRGGLGIPDKPLEQAQAIRTAESEAACRLLGATCLFADFVEHDIDTSPATTRAFIERIQSLQPDVVLAHWPLDTHIDHQLTGVMALRAFLDKSSRFQLYFFEVLSGRQTMHFFPTHHVDITAFRALKKAATFEHHSQHPENWYPHHDLMESFRGAECGVQAAEAFIKAGTSLPDPLSSW